MPAETPLRRPLDTIATERAELPLPWLNIRNVSWAVIWMLGLVAVFVLYFSLAVLRQWQSKAELSHEGLANLLVAVCTLLLCFVTVGSIVVGAKIINSTNRHEVYQKLELASVSLFRFEIDHPEVTAALWVADTLPPKELDRYLLRQHICQTLNLLEMAVRFRKSEIMSHDVFASWVVWISDLCAAKPFQLAWPELRTNYIKDFQRVIDCGLECHTHSSGDTFAAQSRFFARVADDLDCDHIRGWLTNDASQGQAS